MKKIIILLCTFVLLGTPTFAKSALDTIKNAKNGNEILLPEERQEEILEEKLETSERGTEGTKNFVDTISGWFDSSTSKEEIVETGNTIKQQAKGPGKMPGDGVAETSAELANDIDSINKSILNVVLSLCMIPINILYTLYSIGEIGIVALWSVSIILIFLIPKKLIVIRNIGIMLSKVSLIYTLIYLVARVVLN